MTLRARVVMASLSFAACRRAPDAALQPESATGENAIATGYRVEQVLDGATLVMRVQWSGPPPTLAPVTVPVAASPDICGAEETLPLLLVGDARGVANTVAWITDITRGKAPDDAVPIVDQRRCQYAPHVVMQMLGQPVRFTSSDATILHTVRSYHGYGPGESWFTRATPHGVSFETRIDRAGVNTLYCDSGHTWMIGYVIGATNPYFAVSDALGDMTIDHIPPGEHRLHVWHEGFTPAGVGTTGRASYGPAMETEVPFTVTPGGTVRMAAALSSTGLDVVVRPPLSSTDTR